MGKTFSKIAFSISLHFKYVILTLSLNYHTSRWDVIQRKHSFFEYSVKFFLLTQENDVQRMFKLFVTLGTIY